MDWKTGWGYYQREVSRDDSVPILDICDAVEGEEGWTLDRTSKD